MLKIIFQPPNLGLSPETDLIGCPSLGSAIFPQAIQMLHNHADDLGCELRDETDMYDLGTGAAQCGGTEGLKKVFIVLLGVAICVGSGN